MYYMIQYDEDNGFQVEQYDTYEEAKNAENDARAEYANELGDAYTSQYPDWMYDEEHPMWVTVKADEVRDMLLKFNR